MNEVRPLISPIGEMKNIVPFQIWWEETIKKLFPNEYHCLDSWTLENVRVIAAWAFQAGRKSNNDH